MPKKIEVCIIQRRGRVSPGLKLIVWRGSSREAMNAEWKAQGYSDQFYQRLVITPIRITG